MDHPDIDGDTEFSVRLLMNVAANNPEHAVARYISSLNEFGNNTWVYRVMDRGTGEEFMVHPAEGVTYTLEEFEAKMVGADTPEEISARLDGTSSGGE